MQLRMPTRVFGALILGFLILSLPAIWWPGYLDSPIGLALAMPYLSIYLFHNIGIPGLLQHDGACGWGWCAPTPFGWLFLSIFWLGLTWLVALWISVAFFPAETD